MDGNQSKPALLIPAFGGLYGSLSGLMEPVLRVVVGLSLLPHGAQKLFSAFGGGGIGGTAGFLEQAGYSNGMLWATLIALVEFIGGTCLALGLLTRPAALAIVIFLANAVIFHSSNGFFWTSAGFEYPLLWTVCALYFAVRGGGPYSLDAKLGREF
jgi:putative oxidoreductase